MRDLTSRRSVFGVHICSKGACGSIRPLTKPRNYAVSCWRSEPGGGLCCRFGHRDRSCRPGRAVAVSGGGLSLRLWSCRRPAVTSQ